MLKRIIVKLLGRERANRVSAPYHDLKARRRTQRRLENLPSKDLCINLGCGPNIMPGWINVDVARNENLDIVWDLRKGLPFPSESCTAVFGEHVIEHITKEDAFRLLKDCHRVLQKGGVIRLSTPDAGRYLRAYANGGEFLFHPSFVRPIETPMDRINQMVREDGQHLWVYDAESLLLLLRKTGFSSATEQPFGVSAHVRMQQIDSAERAFESLYVEGIK